MTLSPAAPPTSLRGRGWDWLLALLVLALVGAYEWRHRWHDFTPFSDTGAYLAGARSLAAGDGYRFSAHESQPKISLYPPLQSVLLAPAFLGGPHPGGNAFPENLPRLHGIMVGLSLLTLAVVYVFLRTEGVPMIPTALLVLLWGVSAQWLTWLGFLTSDIGFAAVPAALALVWRAGAAGPEWRRWWWLGLGLAVAYWWRTATQAWSLALALIVVGRCVLGGDWRRAAAFILPVAVSYLTWRQLQTGGLGYGEVLRGYFHYYGDWPGYARTLAAHVWILLRGYEFWLLIASPIARWQQLEQKHGQLWLAIPPLLALSAVHLWWLMRTARGFFFSLCARDLAVLFALAIYGVQLFFVPFHGYDYHRYLYPAAPFLFVWFWRSQAAIPILGLPSAFLTCATLASLCVLNIIGRPIVDQMNRPRFSRAEVRELAGWFRDHTPPETRAAVDWNLPLEDWYAGSGRRVWVNESAEAVVLSPVRGAQQTGPAPRYALWSPHANGSTKNPPAGEIVRSSPSGALVLVKLPE